MRLVAAYAISEAMRRRVFAVILILTVAFLAVYALGTFAIFGEVADQGLEGDDLVEENAITGGTLVGLGMFVALFLGVVLAIFMTMSTVRGDAERGVLQAIAVRPVGREALLGGRLLAAIAIAAGYVAIVFAALVLITWAAGDWTPDRLLTPALALMAAVAIVACLSVLGSVHLSATANGIAMFMAFGTGLTAGLLGQIGEALNSNDLERISDIAALALPFEVLYQAGLHELTVDAEGFTEIAINLGPFGGAESAGPFVLLWAAFYAAVVTVLALRGFVRRDL